MSALPPTRFEDLPPGPWSGEAPEKVEFRHAGLPCLIARGTLLNWCGYAAVPPGHPLHGRDGDHADDEVDVHGGVTYAGPCQGHICHVPEPGEPDNVWWMGFDFAHSWDRIPIMALPRNRAAGWDESRNHYWTQDEAMAETRRLAEQLAAIGGGA